MIRIIYNSKQKKKRSIKYKKKSNQDLKKRIEKFYEIYKYIYIDRS